jgi:four helix bundle protein
MGKLFENFPVYQNCLKTAGEINRLCSSIKGAEYLYLKDQIRRASTSIVLNIAEGSGKWGKKDKVNFYRISRGSAYECMAGLDLLDVFNIIDSENISRLKTNLSKIVSELQALIISIEKRNK